MGIKDEFHQIAILSCINELLQQLDDDGAATSDYSTSSDQFPHKMIQRSFNKLERCDKCNKYLRGLLHQGFICQGTLITGKLLRNCCNYLLFSQIAE